MLSKELARSPYIPPIVIRMLKIAEETGDTKSMFEKLADLFEGDLEKILSRVVALAQPVILIVMGGVIGMVMLAVLLPLTQMAQM
jgi:general secretion pathway protein F/type IV pilus assembly protein PilC